MDILQNWITLLSNVNDLSEDECKKLLEVEKKGHRRVAFMLRIYGRMNTQRTQRERKEIRNLVK